MNKGSYSIGLDIGTGSVGWACLSDNYDLLKFRGKPAFGAHIFDPADTAEKRRLERGMRRRYNRRIKRIQMLQELFDPLIENENFFHLTNHKHYWRNNNNFENRTLSETLMEIGYSKKEINERFPTIYHLRNELINSTEEFDIRLVYLAIHNLVKYRGHFLLGNLSWEDREEKDFLELLDYFFERYLIVNEQTQVIDKQVLRRIENILSEKSKTNNDKQKEISKLINKNFKDIGKLLTGLKADISNIFFNCENKDEIREAGLKFSLDDDSEEIDYSSLSEDQEEIIQIAYKIYLDNTLRDILGTSQCISQAKVIEFKKNKKQLKKLRDFIYNNFGDKEGKKLFTSSREALRAYEEKPDKKHLEKLCLFDQYRMNKLVGKKVFFKAVRSYLKKESLLTLDDKEKKKGEEIFDLIEKGEYLSLLNNINNASIPYQNSTYEARKILESQGKFHGGITDEIKENVIKLISFRIPYYVGPLTKEEEPKFGWSERKSNQSITPFSYNDVIDKGASAEKFIKRMTNKCTYLLSEEVLPKHSLLYQEMEVRNELNTIQLRSGTESPNKIYRLSQDIKDIVFENYFKNVKKATHKNFLEFLKKYTNFYDGKSVYGTQKENQFASSLTSYIDFRNILGKDILEKHIKEIEVIISWITIFNEKSIIKEKIQDNFEFISDDQIEAILKLNYKGWGRVSEAVLTYEINGSSIIDLLRVDDYNFMEALTSPKYNFKTSFEKINKSLKNGSKIKYKDIEDLQCSPALKKSIWASIKIVDELVSIFGEPKNIILEFAREEKEKRRNKSREEQWQENIKENHLKKQDEFIEMFDDIKDFEGDIDYTHRKAMLYLRQGGRCLYTLEKIHASSIFNNDGTVKNTSEYEVDHILPRNFVKDDSFDNLALVTKTANQKKSGDKMPLTLPMNNNGLKKKKLIDYWNLLVDNGMMSSSKKSKLMKETFTDQDKESFIARQLVETRQITVHVRNLLEEMMNSEEKNISIEVLKAGIVSEVRRNLHIPKIRGLNDFHHAVDALLVAGLFNFGEDLSPNMFKFDFRNEKAKKKWESIKTNHGKKFNKELFLTFNMKKDKSISDKTFEQVMKKNIDENTPNVTKKTGASEGAFYKQSILSPKVKPPKYKSNKTERHVHDEVKKSFAVLVDYYVKNKKGSLIKKVDLIDTTVIEMAQNDFKNEYEIAKFYAMKNENGIEVIKPKLRLKVYKNDLIHINGEPFYFNSSGELINAKQLHLTTETELLLYEQYSNKYKYNVEKAENVYKKIAQEVVKQYEHLLSSKLLEEKKRKILSLFSGTDKSYNQFVASIDELLKVSSPSATRSDKLCGRFQKSSKKIITDGKYSTTSITGLKYKKPKSLIKFLEE